MLDFAALPAGNCVFFGNRSQASVGALYTYQSRPILLGTMLHDNAAEHAGGGVYLLGVTDAGPLLVRNSTVSGNRPWLGAGPGAWGAEEVCPAFKDAPL